MGTVHVTSAITPIDIHMHTCTTPCIFCTLFLFINNSFWHSLAMIIIYMLIHYGNMCVCVCVCCWYVHVLVSMWTCISMLSQLSPFFIPWILFVCGWKCYRMCSSIFSDVCCYETTESSFVECGEDHYVPRGNKLSLTGLPIGSPVPLKLWVAGRIKTHITVVTFWGKQWHRGCPCHYVC